MDDGATSADGAPRTKANKGARKHNATRTTNMRGVGGLSKREKLDSPHFELIVDVLAP